MRDKNFDVDLLKTLNDQPMPETPLTDDEFTRVLDAACGRLPQKKPAGHRRFPWGRVAAAAAACLAVGLGSINFAAPAVAEQLPVVGSLFSWLNRGGQDDYVSLQSEQLNKYAETVESTAETADSPYTLTRDSENERQRIDQIALVDICLRFNPDILVVGEMRGAEANAAQEAARVGVAVLTTIHSNSCEATYRRMVSLCKRAVDMSDETLLSYVTEAYPIVVFCKQLENKQRRMMEIMECEILPNGDRRYNTLFRYVITENHMENGKFVIEGHHTQVNEISVSLRNRLLENGMPNEELQAFLNPKKEVNAT